MHTDKRNDKGSGMQSDKDGFTLIELSIVLVIIGLVIGSVLVGQDLIKAAEVRATISQIEKYNTATNTFRGKFGYLPGDINAVAANQFGFAPRGSGGGQGDGNGVVDGTNPYESPAGAVPNSVDSGETGMFWVDLSSAVAGNLIEGGFNTAIATGYNPTGIIVTGTSIGLFLPPAKIGRGNYIYVYEGAAMNNGVFATTSINYFGLSAVTGIDNTDYGKPNSTLALTVKEAYSIDQKIDDGYPLTGHVIAQYLNFDYRAPVFLATYTGGCEFQYLQGCVDGPIGYNAGCYDDGNNSANPMTYSISYNAGASLSCALSFQFQ